MNNFKSLCVFAFALFSFFAFYAQSSTTNNSIFQTFVVLDVNGTGNVFYHGGINGCGTCTAFDGLALGNVTSLTLNGGEVQTNKMNTGDVFGAEINYVVYPQSGTPGAFTTISLPFFGQQPGGFGGLDQTWQQALAGVDLLQGLAPGDYVLQVFFRSPTNEGDMFDSNPGGGDYQATFSVAAPPTGVPTLSEWGLILLGLTFLSFGTVVIWKKRYGYAV